MSYQVTISLNSAYTGTTQADDFTIVAKHSNGSPADDTLATGVTKAELIAGVTYTVADTVTGGTVTSTGVCTNSVTWEGIGAAQPTATPTPTPTRTPPPAVTLYTYYITTFIDSISVTDFCTTSYLTGTEIKSEASQISNLLNTMIYDANGDPFIGSSGQYAYISDSIGSSSSSSPDPRYLIEISNLGQCEDLAALDCSGGGSNPL